MFIPESHVAGHPSGFSGSLVQLRESNWHAFRLVLARNTGELLGALWAGTSLSVRDRPNSYKPSHVRRCCILPSLAVSIFFALAVTVRVFISDIQFIDAEMDM
jgi:hypothetical protein